MAATTETFTTDAKIVPWQSRGRAPSGRVFSQFRESTTLVGATDSVVFTFTTTMPTDGVLQLRSFVCSWSVASTTSPQVTLGRYVQGIIDHPDQQTTTALTYPLSSVAALISPTTSNRWFTLGYASSNAAPYGDPLITPPPFKAGVGISPNVFFYDDDGGVAACSVSIDMVFDYYTVEQYSRGMVPLAGAWS